MPDSKKIKSKFISKDEVQKIKRNNMRDKNQTLMFNDTEIGLIKAVFSDNDDLLYLIRKVLLQFDLTQDEAIIVRNAMTPEVYSVVKKRVYPEWSDEYPLTQIPNMLASLTTDIRGRKVEDMAGLFEAKQLEIDYLNQQFAILESYNSGDAVELKIKLSDLRELKGKSLEQRFIDVTAYLWLMGHIEPMLVFLKNIAGQKKETVEDAKKRMIQNSSK